MGDPRNPRRADEPWNLDRFHSTDDCVSVLAARRLLARGISPIGRSELVTRSR